MLRLGMADAVFGEKEQILQAEDISLDITVIEQRASPYTVESYMVESVKDGRSFRATLYARTDMPVLFPGCAYRLENVDLQKIAETVNPYVFDYHAYAKRKGISHRISTGPASGYTSKGIVKPLLYGAFRIRSKISVRFLAVLGIEKGSLVNGFLLGMKNEIPGPLSAMFRQLGISHLLAVSGLHVGLIVLVVFQLLSLLKLPRTARTLLLAAFLYFYCVLSGAAPSVIRSSLMSVLLLAAPLFHRSYHALNTVAATAFILLMAKPFYLQDVGFLFSFAAVFGILTAYRSLKTLLPLKTNNKLIGYSYDMLLVSAAASLFTAPFALYYFNTLQFASLLLNIIAIPLTFCVMISAMFSIPCLFFTGFVSDLVLNALDLCLELFRGMLRIAAASEIWTLTISSYWKPLLLALIISAMLFVCVKKRKICLVVSMLAMICGIIVFFLNRQPELVQYSLQRGKAVVFRHKREALLINTGAVAFSGNDYERFIKPLFIRRGVKRCSVIITSADKYKYGALPYLLRDFPGCSVLAPPGGLDIESEHCVLVDDSSLTIGNFTIIVQCCGQTLDVLIASPKDTITISDGSGPDNHADIVCEHIPDSALHYLFRGGEWHLKK